MTEQNTNLIGELLMKLFHARTAAHVMHLQTRSYSTHMALNVFYDEIVPLADTVAETWLGMYGLIPSFPPRYTPYVDPLKLLEDLGEWITSNRHKIGQPTDSHLQNEIDNIVTLIYQTLYKLNTLK